MRNIIARFGHQMKIDTYRNINGALINCGHFGKFGNNISHIVIASTANDETVQRVFDLAWHGPKWK